jgi:hypothetical protein
MGSLQQVREPEHSKEIGRRKRMLLAYIDAQHIPVLRIFMLYQ